MLISLSFPNLYVHSDNPERACWLVHWQDQHIINSEKEYERMDKFEASRALFGARFDDYDVERFLSRISSRGSLFEVGRAPSWLAGAALLRDFAERGVLIALRRCKEHTLDPFHKAVLEERETVRAFTKLQRTVNLVPGRRCILVSCADYSSVPNRDRYQVVSRGEASALLSAAMTAPALAAGDRALLEKAAKQLAPDWRPPRLPEGLVLLREIPQVAASQNLEPAITPSQLRAMMQAEKSVNLEVVVLGLDDKPLKDIKFTIEAPDDETHEGDLGSSGKTKITSTKKGTASVTLAGAEPES